MTLDHAAQAAQRLQWEIEMDERDEENALARGQTQLSPRESSRTAGEDAGLQKACQSAPFDYWAWARTAPKCRGCGHAFDVENARLTNSPDPQRWCCSTCAKAAVQKNPPCSQCGGPHPFDTTVPSARWNAVIRGRGLPDYLCLTCIVEEFAARGESVTATLWGGVNEFSGLPIEVKVGSR